MKSVGLLGAHHHALQRASHQHDQCEHNVHHADALVIDAD